MRTYLWAALAAGVLLVLAACAAIATQSLILGSPAGGSYYPYAGPFRPAAIGAAVVVCAIVAAMLTLPMPRSARGEWLLLLVWVAIATGCHAVLRWQTPFTFEAIVVSDGANSFFTAAQQHDAATVLRRFSVVRDAMPLHAQSNMPGKLMLIYALETLTTRPAVLAWLLVLLSNAGALLMYAFVRQLRLDSGTALYAAVLYLFVPARIYFFPLMNTVTPVVVLACACLLMRCLTRAAVMPAIVFGIAIYALIFFEPVPLVIGLLFSALVVRAILQRALTWQDAVLQGAVATVTLVATSELVRLLTGFELIRALRDVASHATAFNDVERRPYATWVLANPIQFLFGSGLCPVALFAAAWRERLARAATWAARVIDPIGVVIAGVTTVMIVTDLIGINRGEVIRLWIFLACFVQIPAAHVCVRLNSRAAIVTVVCATAVQAALGTAMIGFVVP